MYLAYREAMSRRMEGGGCGRKQEVPRHEKITIFGLCRCGDGRRQVLHLSVLAPAGSLATNLLGWKAGKQCSTDGPSTPT